MKEGEYIYREDSRDSVFVRHQKKCWSKGVVINVEPTPSRYCKINVVHNGKILVKGEKMFSQYPTNGDNPLTVKVRELYEHYYNKIITKEQKDERIRTAKTEISNSDC